MGWLSALLGSKVKHVDPTRAHQMVAEGAQFVDVRNRREVKVLRAVGAKHIPLNVLQAQIPNLDPQRPVVCLCATGNRSTRAARLLADNGFAGYSVRGGIGAWARSGLPTRSG